MKWLDKLGELDYYHLVFLAFVVFAICATILLLASIFTGNFSWIPMVSK